MQMRPMRSSSSRGPHAAHRVVGAAQQDQLVFGVLGLPLQVLKINPVAVAVLDQRVFHYHTPIRSNCAVEGVVHRSHDDDAVARVGVGLDREEQRGYNARRLVDPFLFHVPVMMALHEADYRIQVGVGGVGVAQNRVVDVALQAFLNFRGIFQLHVGHGKGDDPLGHVGVVGKHVLPFAGAGARTVDDGFKIVMHGDSSCKIFLFRCLTILRPKCISFPGRNQEFRSIIVYIPNN